MMSGSEDEKKLLLGMDIDWWHAWGKKVPIYVDMGMKANKHILLAGFSGSGKSSATLRIVGYIKQIVPNAEIYFADFKQEDDFQFLSCCKNYFPYDRTLEALKIVYDRMNARQARLDLSRNLIVLCFDEFFANILSIQGKDKKLANRVLDQVGEILMLGRSLNIQFICSVQRPDAEVFKHGSRINYGIIILLGKNHQSVYEMVLSKEFIDQIGDRTFEVGEGVVLLQGAKLYFIKTPMIRDRAKLEAVCIKALS